MGAKERRERQRDTTRKSILEAASELAAAEGWHAVTLRRIADRSDYSAPALYGYFDGKESILSQLATDGHRRLAQALKEARTAGHDPADALVRAALAWWDFAGREPDVYRAMHGLDAPKVPAAAARAAAAELREAIGELSRQRAGVEELDDATDLLRALLHGFALLAATGLLPGGRRRGAMLVTQAIGEFLSLRGVGRK